MKHIVISIIALFSLTGVIFAQKSVSLVVVGEGASKEEAVQSALRSAIEQSYGAFVSSNTTILNDELVLDEIVSVSAGNIQKYKELSNSSLPNGLYSITVEATVSLSKLVSFAQSKGSECELAGATIAANLRMANFYAKSEVEAVKNMIIQLREMMRSAYDYSLQIFDPIPKGDNYEIPFVVKLSSNDASKQLCNTLVSTLEALSMDTKTASSYKSITGEKATELIIGNYKMGLFKDSNKTILFRKEESAKLVVDFIEKELAPSMKRIEIIDNTGETHRTQVHTSFFPRVHEPSSPLISTSYDKPYYSISGLWNVPEYELKISVEIPKKDIDKYTNFNIQKY